jgi:hypothetical protein
MSEQKISSRPEVSLRDLHLFTGYANRTFSSSKYVNIDNSLLIHYLLHSDTDSQQKLAS